jgi:hypothetical protein
MSSDDGGVGTVSSSVRRTRSRRGGFVRVACLARGAGVGAGVAAFGVVRRAAVRTVAFRALPREAACCRRGFALALGFRVGAAFFVGRLAERLAGTRFLARFADFIRFAALRRAMAESFRTLTVWR